MANTYTDTP